MKCFIKGLAILSIALKAVSADSEVTCSEDSHCPEDKPCCNQYGTCGSGSFCLGGCNPKFSYKKEACMPLPACQNSETVFSNYKSKLASAYTYLGDYTKANWTYEGYPMDYDDENALILAMPKNSGGTVLSSTRYVWYGNVKARFKASHGGGVVSAFIMFSSVQDEIDYEWVGVDTQKVQTNWYWQGALNYTNSKNLTATSYDDDYHVYEIDWKEDAVTWLVDGQPGRTLFKNETYNETSKQYNYPQTPARIQLSIWPGGNATNAPGTIAWAGGLIDWDSQDIQENGYYYSIVESVNITCYDPPAGVKKNGTQVYQYTGDDDYMEGGVFLSNANTVLKDYDNSGLDDNTPDKKSSSSSSSSATKTSSSSSSASTSSSKSDSKSQTQTQAKSSSTTESNEGHQADNSSAVSETAESTSSSSSAAVTGFVQNVATASASGSTTASGSPSKAAGSNNTPFSFGMSLVSLLFFFI